MILLVVFNLIACKKKDPTHRVTNTSSTGTANNCVPVSQSMGGAYTKWTGCMDIPLAAGVRLNYIKSNCPTSDQNFYELKGFGHAVQPCVKEGKALTVKNYTVLINEADSTGVVYDGGKNDLGEINTFSLIITGKQDAFLTVYNDGIFEKVIYKRK